jgi:hypothetical protein
LQSRLSSVSHRALFAIDGIAAEQEHAFAMKAISWSTLKAYERILDARHQADVPQGLNNAPNEDEPIEAEAARLCRQ